MKDKYMEPTTQRSQGTHSMDRPLTAIDLPLLIEQIKAEKSWTEGQRSGITVFKTTQLHIVLIALHEGSELARHVAHGIISVQVLEGRMLFRTDQQSVEIGEGQMLVLQEEIFHSVKAIRQTFFLLTVTNSFATKRSHL